MKPAILAVELAMVEALRKSNFWELADIILGMCWGYVEAFWDQHHELGMIIFFFGYKPYG